MEQKKLTKRVYHNESGVIIKCRWCGGVDFDQLGDAAYDGSFLVSCTNCKDEPVMHTATGEFFLEDNDG